MIDTVAFLKDKLSLSDGLFKLLVSQLEKDFQMSVCSQIIFTAETPEDLVRQVAYQINNIINTHSVSKLSSLLYRVDVSEGDVSNISTKELEVYIETLTYFILKREFKKVYIRNTYG